MPIDRWADIITLSYVYLPTYVCGCCQLIDPTFITAFITCILYTYSYEPPKYKYTPMKIACTQTSNDSLLLQQQLAMVHRLIGSNGGLLAEGMVLAYCKG